jgi:hypothetical protein
MSGATRDLEFAQFRATASVRRLTGLDDHDARHVVLDDVHILYDADRPSTIDENETLRDEVRKAIADHLNLNSPANSFVVVSLLEALDGPWRQAYGDTIELALPDDREALVWSGHWSHCAVATDGGYEYWWTGLPDDCPDPLIVADALTALVEGGPAAGRVVAAVEQVVPTCHRCGAEVVPLIYGMPGSDLMALDMMGYVRLGGCVLPETGSPDPDLGECPRCGEQRLLTLAGDDPAAGG